MSDIVVPDDPGRLSWAMTIGELVDRVASRNPHKVYLYYQNYQVTYQELLQDTLRTAGLFHDLGVRRGDRVCLLLPNGREFLYSWMGLSRLGAICVPINTAFKEAEAAYIIDNAEAKVLLSHHTLREVAQEAALRCPSLDETLIVSEGGETYPGWRDFWPLLRAASPFEPLGTDEVQPEDVSMLVYTSGTTGNPKGVMITHQMYIAAGQGFASWTSATSEDRLFTCLPYIHANVQYYSTMGSLAVGASLILTDRFSASRFLQQVRESRATVVNYIGMMMPVLLKQPPSDQDRDNSVRLFYGSPALDLEVIQEFENRFGAEVIIGFGSTETCYGTVERLGQPHRRGSSGLPRWHPDPRFQNELRIVDDQERPLPAGEVGEVTLSSPAVMPGYWRDPERTREALRDGWLYTGDLGKLDEDGYLYYVDRKKDMIRRRGENISPQEVEDVIRTHPGVLYCAVIAVPSELGEDEVKAYVVPRNHGPSTGKESPENPAPEESGHDGEDEEAPLNPEDVVYWCADQLAYFKVPRYIEFRDDLPRTPSLRVRKDELRREREDLASGCFDREKAGIRLR